MPYQTDSAGYTYMSTISICNIDKKTCLGVSVGGIRGSKGGDMGMFGGRKEKVRKRFYCVIVNLNKKNNLKR